MPDSRNDGEKGALDNQVRKKHQKIVRQRILAVVVTLLILGGLTAAAIFALPKLIEPILPETLFGEAGEPEETVSEDEPPGEEEEEEVKEPEEEIDSEKLEEQVEDALAEAEEEEVDPEVQGAINVMTNEQKIAQLFFVTPEALTKVDPTTAVGERTKEAYLAAPVGGLIYFSKNFEDPSQTKAMLESMQETALSVNSLPVFLGVDEEGGSVARLADNPAFALEDVGSMASLGAEGSAEKAKEAGKAIGTYLSEYGFNLDFAPVADVSGNDAPAVGDRAFGSDPNLVSGMAVNFAYGLEEAGVFACFKHYPGFGAAGQNTDQTEVTLPMSMDELRAKDLVPFREAVEAGASFIMASHAEYSAVESGVSASMSEKLLQEVLREELGYEGIIITDALNARAVTSRYSSGEAAVKAFEAGCDMLLMPESFEEAYEAMRHAYETGEISNERLTESLIRILTLKLKSGKLALPAQQ